MKLSSVIDLQPSPILLSGACHALIVAILFFSQMTQNSRAPRGFSRLGDSTLIEISSARVSHKNERAQKTQPTSPVSDPEAVVIKTKTTPSIPESQPDTQAQFGVKNGIDAEGALGVAHGTSNSLKERYLYELRLLIEGRKIYPLASKRFGETGTAVVRFIVEKSGKIKDVSITGPARFDRLNTAALALVTQIERYKPIPSEMGEENLTVSVPIQYRLD